ncbi:MAG: hypothetical protein II321_02590, partial [Lachnospiraceae bacterium]|nr:hypothetical protein [Lachnospiraceae bacterium]
QIRYVSWKGADFISYCKDDSIILIDCKRSLNSGFQCKLCTIEMMNTFTKKGNADKFNISFT